MGSGVTHRKTAFYLLSAPTSTLPLPSRYLSHGSFYQLPSNIRAVH